MSYKIHTTIYVYGIYVELLKVAPFMSSSYKRIKRIMYETSKQHVCDL